MSSSVRSAGLSDDQVMAQIVARSADAFDELYARYRDRAYRIAWAVCHDHGCAQDAVQDAFLSIWRNSASYRSQRGTVAAWLLSVVRHRAIESCRRGRPEVDDRLPPAEREVISLAVHGELSHTEIEDQLGLPAGTVKRRMRLGLDRLRASVDRPL